MYRSLFLLLSTFLLAAFSGFAQVAHITVGTEGVSQREVYLLQFEDHVSKRWKVLDSAVPDDNGAFRFDLNLTQTELVSLRSDAWFADFYVSPGDELQVKLTQPTRGRARRFSLNPWLLEIEGEENVNARLANLYQGFDQRRDSSIVEMAMYFTSGSTSYRNARMDELLNTGLVSEEDSLKREAGDAVAIHQFINAYLDSASQSHASLPKDQRRVLEATIARMRMASGNTGEDALTNYLKSYESDPTNPEYTQLVEEVYLNELLRFDSLNELTSAVKVGNDESLTETLNRLPLSNVVEDEWLLKATCLRTCWYADQSYQRGVLRILHSRKEEPMANAMFLELTQATIHAEHFLPNITLLNYKDERVNLADFEGQLVYLNVVQLESPSCLKELTLLQNYVKKYGRQVKFVTIAMDEDPKVLTRFLANHRDYDWEFLRGSGHPDLRRSLGLRTIPSFFLVFPNGDLMDKYTPMPSENLDYKLKVLTTGPPPERIKVWDD